MSRSAHQRQQQKLQLQQQLLAQQQVAENESAAAAAELFDLLCVATTMRQILGLHRNMCELVGLRPSPLNEFYPKLKVKIRSWKAQALWKKFDARASQRVYAKGNACTGTRVLVIGAGPCGLRTAIEAQLLGAKVVVVEKRDRVSRNNVLHLWPFVITDLRSLGAKKFYGKFCAGSIDHISIRQIQCILLKVALLLGVEVHEGVSFEQTIEPNGDGCGWRAAVLPSDHAVSHYEFDVLIGADGKRNTLEGFKRKEFRGKLAIAITANFINKKTEAEAKVEEISGVAFIFNQSFFKELYHTTGIDLENIVYYKDETHYFVMTAKKHSLIDKGVIIQDFADPAELLASGNVNTEKLLDYAREAAEFSTKYQMPNLEFAVNHYGKPDVAMFDFTSMFAAESSCRVIVRKNYRLLQCLVGDSLLEPFWPTGSGCARGFLSSMDAAYTIKLWSNPCNSVLGVVAQRESIYRLLNQTTPENLQRDIGSYTVDPATRYPNLNRTSVNVWQIKHLVDADDKSILEQTYMDTNALQITQVDTPIRRKRRSGDMVPLSSVLLRWICSQLHAYDFTKELKEVSDVFTNGKVLCALINRYRPDLVDFNAIQNQKPAECNDLAFKIFEKEMHIQGIMSGKESLQLNAIDSKLWLNYLEQICEVFRGEIPHVKHPKIDFSELREKYRLNNAHAQPDFSKLLQLSSKQKAKSPLQDKVNIPQGVSRRTTLMDDEKLKRQRRHEQLIDNHQYHGQGQNTDMPRKGKKRRNVDKAANISAKMALAFKKQTVSEKCHFCKQTVYLMEKLHTEDLVMHRGCLKCHHCHTNLRLGGYAFDRDDPNGRFYCTQHFRLPAKAIRPMVRKIGQKKASNLNQSKQKEQSPSNKVVDSDNAVVSVCDDSKRHLMDKVTQMEMLDRGQTPERIEFENIDAMSDGEPSEEHIIDEHEWSGRNFLPESNNDAESDLSTTDVSDSDSDSDIYEEANDSPLGAQTLQLATDWIGKQKYTESDDSDEFYDSSEGIADDGKDDTEGEEFQKARELRREEVRLQPLPNLPTDTETEVQTETETSSADEVELNSATEISTDSEFDNDELMRETPKIFIDDTHLRKPTKIQIKSTVLPPTITGHKCNNFSHNNNAQNKFDNDYTNNYKMKSPPVPQFKPLVQVDPTLLNTNRIPLKNPRVGDYLLNKTASTEGIASKKSLELKKRYLLGEQSNGSKIQKSGSTSVLDSRIRSFQSNISECQKLLNPGNEISPEMKTFLDRTKLGEKGATESVRSATNDILNDLRIEITIQKASSTASTDNEKENSFVNNKNELNKGTEYAETVNTALMESILKKSLTALPKNSPNIIETIDLVTPEKQNKSIDDSNRIVDLTCDTPEKEPEITSIVPNMNQPINCLYLKTNDNINKFMHVNCETSIKNDLTIIADSKPDVSKGIKQNIPDILNHIEQEEKHFEKEITCLDDDDENKSLLNNSGDNEEKADFPEKQDNLDVCDVKIEVPNIPWKSLKSRDSSASTVSSCSSRSSSIGDIEHYILESTTSPETNNCGIIPSSQYHQVKVPRVEVHDSSGTLMQIDSLMIIDGKYIGDPEDLKYMEIPRDLIILTQQQSMMQNSIMEDHTEGDTEPLTVSPEPVDQTVIDTCQDRLSSKAKISDLKFDSKNENKVESLKNLPLVIERTIGRKNEVVKPGSLNLKSSSKFTTETASTPIDIDKTPTADILSRASDSETEPTGTGQILTETELSDWTADECISENFIDIEFALNATKTTTKRNKKIKKKYDSCIKLPSTSEVLEEVTKAAPVAECEDILRAIDVDDIEFMDTGSDVVESSHATTDRTLQDSKVNTDVVDTNCKYTSTRNKQSMLKPSKESQWHQQIQMKRDEKLGIDYIEQGAYIMHDLNKTPVNETPDANLVGNGDGNKLLPSSQILQSLTDSSTLHDIEDDTTCAVTVEFSSNAAATSPSINKKTNISQPESEALTIVTSLYDSSSLKTHTSGIETQGAEESTPSSSEQIPRTSLSTESRSSSKVTPPSNNRQEDNEDISSNYRKYTEEITYEDYVRALQQKITQISSACGETLDLRKQRKKVAKTDGAVTSANSASAYNVSQTVEEVNSENLSAIALTNKESNVQKLSNAQKCSAMHTVQNNINPVNTKVPEIPTLTRKLEEITKERTKQKDLIHDLVMDKLQSKKQLNAEKRLNRNRQRSLLTSPNTKSPVNETTNPTSSKRAPIESTAIFGGVCTNIKAHYHISTAAATNSKPKLFNTSNFKEHKSISSCMSPYCAQTQQASLTISNIQRPHIENVKNDPNNPYHLSLQKNTDQTGQENQAVTKSTPVAPLRQNRGRQTSTPDISRSVTIGECAFSLLTENLRSEARARARLKSNTELGLSPEDKTALLRERLQADYSKIRTKDDLLRKMNSSIENTSKSVNDLSCDNKAPENPGYQHLEHSIKGDVKVNLDFTSDPNLVASSSSSTTNKTKTGRRFKNPERRKSLIQSLSNFFHKSTSTSMSTSTSTSTSMHPEKQDNKYHNQENSSAVANRSESSHLASLERPGTGSSTNSITPHKISNSIDGVLSRFRISPRSKEKSKEKKELFNSCTSVTTQCLQLGKSCDITNLTPARDGGLLQTNCDGLQSNPNTSLLQSLHTNSSSCHNFKHNNIGIQSHNSDILQQSSSSSSSSSSQQQQQLQHELQQQKKLQLYQQQQQQHKLINHRSLDHANEHCLINHHAKLSQKRSASSSALTFTSTVTTAASPPLALVNKSYSMTNAAINNNNNNCDEQIPPPIPPLPLNYQRSDDESNATENREQRKQRAMSKASRQAELKRLRIAQEIQREQEEIEVQLKELEARGVLIEKALRGEMQQYDNPDITTSTIGGSDEILLKELLEIWRNITHLKQRDEELSIRQHELQLEHRHAQLKEELNLRLSCNKLEKSSADVAAEGAILNEMLEIVAKRASLRPSISANDLISTSNHQILLNTSNQCEQTSTHNNESNV